MSCRFLHRTSMTSGRLCSSQESFGVRTPTARQSAESWPRGDLDGLLVGVVEVQARPDVAVGVLALDDLEFQFEETSLPVPRRLHFALDDDGQILGRGNGSKLTFGSTSFALNPFRSLTEFSL